MVKREINMAPNKYKFLVGPDNGLDWNIYMRRVRIDKRFPNCIITNVAKYIL